MHFSQIKAMYGTKVMVWVLMLSEHQSMVHEIIQLSLEGLLAVPGIVLVPLLLQPVQKFILSHDYRSIFRFHAPIIILWIDSTGPWCLSGERSPPLVRALILWPPLNLRPEVSMQTWLMNSLRNAYIRQLYVSWAGYTRGSSMQIHWIRLSCLPI